MERSLGQGARVTALRRLRGGTSSAVHLLHTRDARRDTRALVLRRFVRDDWLVEEPDVAQREARILHALEGAGLPAWPGRGAPSRSGEDR